MFQTGCLITSMLLMSYVRFLTFPETKTFFRIRLLPTTWFVSPKLFLVGSRIFLNASGGGTLLRSTFITSTAFYKTVHGFAVQERSVPVTGLTTSFEF